MFLRLSIILLKPIFSLLIIGLIIGKFHENDTSLLLFGTFISGVFRVLAEIGGEIITINLGVWTYTLPLQLFGVPLLAIFLLILFHTTIFLFFTYLCKKLNIYNPVFNNKHYE